MIKRIVFISGVELGFYALEGILDSEIYKKQQIELAAIFSLDESKKSRTSGFKSFSELAKKEGIPIHTISSIKNTETIKKIESYEPDFIFIIGWSELAPSSLLNIPMEKNNGTDRNTKDYGCFGIHPTLLPIGRGRAPIPWSIIKGYTKSGVTLFNLEDEADTGDIIYQKSFDINFYDDASVIYKKVATIHYEIIKEVLPLIATGEFNKIPQNNEIASVWAKRTPKDGIIEWNKSSIEIYNWIRALTHPYPGAFTYFNNRKLIIWKAKIEENVSKDINNDFKVGQIIQISNNGIKVACKNSSIFLLNLEFEGDIKRDALDFSNKYDVKEKMFLG